MIAVPAYFKCRAGAAAVLLALVTLLPVNSANALDVETKLFGGRCDSVPAGIRAQVEAYVSDWKALADNTMVIKVLNAARNYAMSQCPGVRVIGVSVRSPAMFNFGIDAGWLGGDQWNVTRNNVAQMIHLENGQIAQKERAEAEAAKQAEAKQQAAAAAKAIQAKFISDNGVTMFVPLQQLKANPFPYKDKIVGLRADFTQMLSESEGIFGDLIVANTPSTLFTRQGTPTILAIKVLGIKPTKIFGTEVPLPYGSYVGSYICSQSTCSDFTGSR